MLRAYDFSIADYIEWNVGYRVNWLAATITETSLIRPISLKLKGKKMPQTSILLRHCIID